MEDRKKWKEEFSRRLVRFTVSIIKLARINVSDRTLAPIFNQIIRSAASVGANVNEASGSVTKAGFARYFHIALQSANETNYWLAVLEEAELKQPTDLNGIKNELSELSRIITASLKTMSRVPA